MADQGLSTLHRQVNRVGRRLFVQGVLDRLVWCWTTALIVAVCWILAEPFVVEGPPAWLRWSVAGGLLAASAILAVVLSWVHAPSRTYAALELDEKFGLKERITTMLTLQPEQAATPAGLALLADAQARVKDLDVASRFPVALSRSAALVPLAAVALALVAIFYHPDLTPATAAKSSSDQSQPPANKEMIDRKMQELAKKREKKEPSGRPRSEDLKHLEEKLEAIAQRSRNTKEQLRERVKEMTALEDELKKKEKQLSEKTANLKQQLAQMDKASGQDTKDGPAKDLQEALAKGNMEKAKDALEQLAKKIKNEEFSKKDLDKLSQQLKNLEDKMKKQANLEDKKEKLEQLRREGKLDQEAFEREMNNLQQQMEKNQDLKDLAEKLGQARQALEKGDPKQLERAMEEAKAKLDDLGKDAQDLDDLRDQLDRLDGAKDAASKGLEGDEGGDGQGDGEGGDGDGNGTGDYANGGGVGKGRRSRGKDVETKSYDTKAKVDFDAKGKKIVEGYAPGQNFKKRTNSEISGEIKQASQEAPEAIEQQRIPRAYRESAKGYFRNLGGQGGDKEPAKNDEN
jgi:chemotaxis protein histidine kinase CheA